MRCLKFKVGPGCNSDMIVDSAIESSESLAGVQTVIIQLCVISGLGVFSVFVVWTKFLQTIYSLMFDQSDSLAVAIAPIPEIGSRGLEEPVAVNCQSLAASS